MAWRRTIPIPGLLVEPGLGLFDGGILDQNMVSAHRLGRLIVACAEEAVPMGFGLCEEAGLVVEPDRRMRVIGGQGVIVVEVDPKGLSYEDDVFAVRGVRRAAGAAAGLDRHRPGRARAMVAAAPAA